MDANGFDSFFSCAENGFKGSAIRMKYGGIGGEIRNSYIVYRRNSSKLSYFSGRAIREHARNEEKEPVNVQRAPP